MNKHTVDVNYFPGWVRKSVSFTIDDGDLENDRKLLDIVKPAGILGTFNLGAHNLHKMSAEAYRAFYRGYGIADHCKYHPIAFEEGDEYQISDEPFDEATADPAYLYSYHGIPGIYYTKMRFGWGRRATAEAYLRSAKEGFLELREVFGERVTSFVWPFRQMRNNEIVEGIRNAGYASVRQSLNVFGEDGFAVPEERFGWGWSARSSNLLDIAQKYEEYPDDGGLKMFVFGVHSKDFERENKWDDLRVFAQRFGNQPEKYFSESVENIFLYADATKEVEITDGYVYNPTEIDLYIKVDGERVTLRAKEKYML